MNVLYLKSGDVNLHNNTLLLELIQLYDPTTVLTTTSVKSTLVNELKSIISKKMLKFLVSILFQMYLYIYRRNIKLYIFLTACI